MLFSGLGFRAQGIGYSLRCHGLGYYCRGRIRARVGVSAED